MFTVIIAKRKHSIFYRKIYVFSSINVLERIKFYRQLAARFFHVGRWPTFDVIAQRGEGECADEFGVVDYL